MCLQYVPYFISYTRNIKHIRNLTNTKSNQKPITVQELTALRCSLFWIALDSTTPSGPSCPYKPRHLTASGL